MPDTDTRNTAAWTTYGAHRPARGIELTELEGRARDILDAGPGIEVLGLQVEGGPLERVAPGGPPGPLASVRQREASPVVSSHGMAGSG
ncbi:hypothetical protein [Streptomyces sennicomposti]